MLLQGSGLLSQVLDLLLIIKMSLLEYVILVIFIVLHLCLQLLDFLFLFLSGPFNAFFVRLVIFFDLLLQTLYKLIVLRLGLGIALRHRLDLLLLLLQFPLQFGVLIRQFLQLS